MLPHHLRDDVAKGVCNSMRPGTLRRRLLGLSVVVELPRHPIFDDFPTMDEGEFSLLLPRKLSLAYGEKDGFVWDNPEVSEPSSSEALTVESPLQPASADTKNSTTKTTLSKAVFGETIPP